MRSGAGKFRPGWTSLFLTCILVVATDVGAQHPAPNGQRSTGLGVYSREQWMRGRDVYAGMCAGCPSAHMTLYLGVETALRDEMQEFETLRLI